MGFFDFLGGQKAPKGPKWKDLLSKIDTLVNQNQDLFKEALDFNKDSFSKGQDFVDQIAKYGLDKAGELGTAAKNFKADTAAQLGNMQTAIDEFGKANVDEYGRARTQADTLTKALTPGIRSEAALGKTLTDRYSKQGIAAEDKYLKKLEGWDTTARREQEAGTAVSDIGQAQDAARESELRRLEGFGIDPSQTRSAALDSRLRAQEALSKAGGANLARRRVEGEGLTLGGQAVDIRNQSAQLGQAASAGAAQQGVASAAIGAAPGAQYLTGLGQQAGYQGQLAGLGQQAGSLGYNMQLGANNFGISAIGGAANQQNATNQFGSGMYDQAGNFIGSSAGMTQGGYATGGNLNANDIQRVAQNNASSPMSALGSIAGVALPLLGGPLGAAVGGMMGPAATAGMSAAGGMLKANEGGPIPSSASPSGGGIPDDVHTMLGAGEYVMDRDTVEWFGKKHFADLQKKAKEGMTGIPANKKRAA